MRVRVAATVFVAVSLLMSTAGCTFLSPQMVKNYDASDGVGTTIGDIEVRNAVLLTTGGERASLLVNLINNGQKTVDVKIQYDSTTASGATDKVDTTIKLDGGEVKTFGSANTDTLIFNGIDTQPGALFPVFVQYGTKTGKRLRVPVLNGALKEYSTLVPTPKSTNSPVPVPLPSGTPAK